MSDKPSAAATAFVDMIARVVQEHTLSDGEFDYEVRDGMAERLDAFAAERVREARLDEAKSRTRCRNLMHGFACNCERIAQLEREKDRGGKGGAAIFSTE